jgi:hypothetical protein
MEFNCLICDEKLEKPGAILFSPPTPSPELCYKFHICEKCFISLYNRIQQGELN